MNPKLVHASKLRADRRVSTQAPCIGRLAGVTESGDILVQHAGADRPMAARWVSRLSRETLAEGIRSGADVLLVFDSGDQGRPVITDFVTPLQVTPLRIVDAGGAISAPTVNAQVDGRRVTIEAQERIVLQCGKGSITLTRDGKIVVRGTQILSRASGANKIKGASVSIN